MITGELEERAVDDVLDTVHFLFCQTIMRKTIDELYHNRAEMERTSVLRFISHNWNPAFCAKSFQYFEYQSVDQNSDQVFPF